MKHIFGVIFIFSCFQLIKAQSDSIVVRILSETHQEMHYNSTTRISTAYLNVDGNMFFYSDSKKFKTFYSPGISKYSGFRCSGEYNKISDTNGILKLYTGKTGNKLYFLEMRSDTFYLDSVQPDSTGIIALEFRNEKSDEGVFTVDYIKNTHVSNWDLAISNMNTDGLMRENHQYKVYDALRNKCLHAPDANTSLAFYIFYAKSFRMVNEKQFNKIKKEKMKF
ncbi:MAG: hypothetical protein KG003_06965 [Bacteroidetes bacterium]|nr:hypothetical protein [Bacteroidota bacterium]